MNSNVTGSSPDPLLNASLTTGSGLGPATGNTAAPPQTPPSPSGVSPSEFQIFEGVDVLDSGRVVVQQLPEQQWGRKDYQADPRQPILILPDPEGAMGPQPFEPSWQRAVNKFFRDQVKEAVAKKFEEAGGTPELAQELLQKYKESGDGIAFIQAFFQGGTEKDTSTGLAKKPGAQAEAMPSKPEAETAAGKTTVSGKETELGVGKEPVRVKEDKPAVGKEGEPRGEERKGSAPQLPLPFLNAITNIIVQATVIGKVGELGEDAKKIATNATQQTQKAWQLKTGENGWEPGTQDIKKWTPISTNVVPPVNVDVYRREELGQNVEILCSHLDEAANKIMGDIPPNNPIRIAVADLIRVLANAIRDLKNILQELQMIDADISTKMSEQKFDELKSLKEIIDQNIKKIDEAAESRRKQAETSKIMKILAPIISAIVIIVGVIALPFTAGGSTALIVAGLVIASVMMAYTIADSVFDVTSKVVAAFNTLMEKINPAWLRTLTKALILAIVVIILVVAVVASGGSAAGSIGAQVAAQVAKQLTIQFAIMFIMSSNILPELFVNALIASGALDPNDEKTKMIVQMVIMAITMIATLGLVAKGQGAIKSLGNTLSEGAKSVGQAFKDFGAAMVRVAKIATEQGLKAAISELQHMINNLMRMLGQMIKQGFVSAGDAISAGFDKVKAAANEFGAALTRAGAAAKTSFESAKETILKAGERFLEALKDFGNLLADAAVRARQEPLKLLKDIGKATAKELRHFAKNLKELGPNFKHMLMGAVEIFDLSTTRDAIKQLLAGTSNLPSEELNKVSRQVADATKQTQDFLRVAQLSIEAGGAIYIGVIGLDLVRILKEQGNLEAAKEVTDLLIKLFQKLMDSFQEGLSARGEWINSLDQAIASLYGSASQMSTKATQQQIA